MLAIAPDTLLPASLKSSWPHLDERTVMDRLDDLKANPNLIDQGALGLCGEAAFFHHILQRDPVLFGAMAKLLFMDGWGFLHDLKIHPDSDLRNADYGAIDTARVAEAAQALMHNPPEHLASIPPQADWMILSSLCDTTNLVWDFEGGPHENVADGAYFWQLMKWYKQSTLYTDVKKYSDNDVATIRSTIVKTANTHITFGIECEMLDATWTGGHFITLESPIIIDEVADRVSFDYWTWGRASFSSIRSDLTVAQFQSSYQGAIVATF